MKARSGAEPEVAAMFGAAIFGICLLQADQARFLSNGLLIAVALIVTYVYPKERPQIPQLLIYWACLATSTLFDEAFAASFPLYYVFKILAMACLFLKPFGFAQKIQELLEKNKIAADVGAPIADEPDHVPFNAEELRELEKAKHKKSPPPEKPEGESTPSAKSPATKHTARTQNDITSPRPPTSKLKCIYIY